MLTLAARAYRRYATPLADVMAAADAVADGDLTVRVVERGPGEFARLSRSFNRMTAALERSDQARRNLTADVAHELRNPLHIIQGNLEGVIDGVYAPSVEHIAATLEETRALTRLIEDLQTISAAEAGQLTLITEVVDVANLLDDVATCVRTAGYRSRYRANRHRDRRAVGAHAVRRPRATPPGAGESRDQCAAAHAGRRRNRPPGRAARRGGAAHHRTRQRALGLPLPRYPTSLTAFGAVTRRAATKAGPAAAWVWPSCASLWKPTAGGLQSRAAFTAKEPHLRLTFPVEIRDSALDDPTTRRKRASAACVGRRRSGC